MLPADGGSFQGIDPQSLSQLMTSLSGGVNRAQPLAESYLTQFGSVGLDTGSVSKLLKDYGWASAQQAMLHRRYSLASHQPSGNFTGGWTDEGAGGLLFATTGAAKKAGAAEAQKMQALLSGGGDSSSIMNAMRTLAQNEGDADYMAAFFETLGPSGLFYLSLYAQGGGSGAADDEEEVRQIIGQGLATASYEMPLTSDFLQGIKPDEEGVTEEPYPGGWDTAALAPFLTEGEFSTQWLQTMSPAVLHQEGVQMGEQVPPGYDAIFQAIANNPGYAATFFHDNYTELSNYMTDPVLYHYLASGPGFGAFLEAATIAPAGTSPGPYQANAAKFIQLFGDSGADTSDTVRQVMAADTTAYWNDMIGTVTAAAPGAGSGMGLNASEWGMFVQDAMQDKTSAAYLLTYYATWKNGQPMDSLAKYGAGDGPDTPAHAGYWHDSSYGMLDYFFASNYQAAGATAGDDSGSVKEILLGAASAGAATLLTSAVFGPEAGVGELLADAGKDAFSSGTEDTLNNLTAKLADGGGGSGSGGLDSNLTDIQKQWASAVDNTWQQSGSTPGDSKFPTVHYNGQPYNGDPLPYEKQYGGYFMNSDGTLKSPSYIQQHPDALAAYNAWLQDPAVSNQVGPYFATQSGGSLISLYDHLMSGGGG